MSENLGDAVLTLRTNNLAFNAGMKSAEVRMKAFSASARVAGMALTAGLTLPIVGLGYVVTKAFTGFNKAMTGSLAIMGDVSEAMQDRMVVAARRMGRETLFSAEQAAESYFFLASAGLSAEQSIANLPIVADFAQAGLFDMALATDLLTDAQSALGLVTGDTAKDMENMTRVGDVLAQANKMANATVQQFSEALTNELGASLKTANKDVEEGVAVLAAFADQGVKGQVAGAQLARIMRLMGSAAVNNTEAMAELGVTVFDAQGNWLNFADIIESMENAFDGMSDAQRVAALESIGFTARVQGAILPLLGTSEAIRQYEEDARNAAGTMKEISENQLKSASAKWTLFKGRLEDVAIVIGGALVPALLDLMSALLPIIDGTAALAEAFTDLSPTAQRITFVVLAVVAAVGPLLFIVGALVGAVGGLLAPFAGVAAAVAAVVTPFTAFGLAGGLLYTALAILASPFAILVVTLGLIAAATALVVWKWEKLGPVITPIVMLFTEGLQEILDRLWATAGVLDDLLELSVKPFFGFIINNRPALVAAIVAIGVAFAWVFPPYGLVVALVVITGAISVLQTANEDLGVSALETKLLMLQLAESFLVGAKAAQDAILYGIGPLGEALRLAGGGLNQLGDEADEMHGRVLAASAALVEMRLDSEQAAQATAFLVDNMAALAPVMAGGTEDIVAYAHAQAEAWAEDFKKAHSTSVTAGELLKLKRRYFDTTVEMLENARQSGDWSRAIQAAADAAGVSLDTYVAKLALATQWTIVMTAATKLSQSSLLDLGSNLQDYIAAIMVLPALVRDVMSSIAVVVTGAGGVGGVGGVGGGVESGGGGGVEPRTVFDAISDGIITLAEATEFGLSASQAVVLELTHDVGELRERAFRAQVELGKLWLQLSTTSSVAEEATVVWKEMQVVRAQAAFDQRVQMEVLRRVVGASGLAAGVWMFERAIRDLGFTFDATKTDVQNLADAAARAFRSVQSILDSIFGRPTREAAQLQLKLDLLQRQRLDVFDDATDFLSISMRQAFDNEIATLQRAINIRRADTEILRSRAILADATLLTDRERAVQSELRIEQIRIESELLHGLNMRIGLEILAREDATGSLNDFVEALNAAERAVFTVAPPALQQVSGFASVSEVRVAPAPPQLTSVENKFEFHLTADSEPTERLLKEWSRKTKEDINSSLRIGDLSGNYVGSGVFGQV